MKIHLGFTVTGDRSSVVEATKIVELLVKTDINWLESAL
jgi:hypothetical protein